MPRRTARPGMLTEAELELMTILWRLGGGTVREVIDLLPKDRARGYTSISTIVRILEQKHFVRAEKVGRGHRYIPIVDQTSYQARNLRHIVGGLFGGDPLSLVRRLVQSSELSDDDLAELRNIVEQKLAP